MNIPGLTKTHMRKNISTLKIVNDKIADFYELFSHFTQGSWVFETRKLYEFQSKM